MPPAAAYLVGKLMPRFLTSFFFATYLLGLTPLLVAQNHVAGLVYERKGPGFVPIPQAHVEAQSAAGQLVGQVRTDGFERYMLSDLPAGEIVLAAMHSSFYPARVGKHPERKVRCSGAGLCGKVDFELIPNGELEVHVTDVNGQPVDDIIVTVRSLTEPTSGLLGGIGLGQRSHRGVFPAWEMRPGRYRVEAEPEKRQRGLTYHPIATEVEFEYGQTSKTVRLTMPSTRMYRITGTILGLEPPEAPRMLIVLDPEGDEQANGGTQGRRLGAPLDQDGSFLVDGIRRGSYSLSLVRTDGSTLRPSQGPEHSLGKIKVDDDLRGLLFTLPVGIRLE